MKTITFYSEKGGVGKSSSAIMYASWLQQNHGLKVGVADFNMRISNYRQKEIHNRLKFIETNPDTGIQPFDEKNAWPIVNAWTRDINEYKEQGRVKPYASWFMDQIEKGELKDLDVVICDFPGSLADGSFADLISMRLIGLIVIPTERDEMTLCSTIKLHNMLAAYNANYCCFINKAQLGLQNFRKNYMALARRLVKLNVPMLPDMISYSDRMTTMNKVDIIRSTFGFPDFSKPEYAGVSDLGLENLFIDVTRLLSETADLTGTAPADLSFAAAMIKKDDKRHFSGSSYPQFEIK